MRVRIVAWRPGGEPVRIGDDGQWLRVTFDDRTGRGAALRGPVTVQRRAEQWRVTDGSGSGARTYTTPAIIVRTLNDDDPTIALDARRFGGALHCVALPDRGDVAFDVVNHLPMEQYLPGVLARELYAHWQPATFAAQAVAARSFAAQEHLHYETRRHFDVTDTVSSQAYIGDVDLNVAHQAVQHTGGQLLAYDDTLVPGYYCSCCGGTAAPATAMIGSNPVNALPPLNGRKGKDVCTEAPLYRWQIDRPIDELTQRFKTYGGHTGKPALAAMNTLRAIDVHSVTENGRPLTFRVTAAKAGPVELPSEQLRSAANFHDSNVPAPKKSLWSSFVDVTIDNETAHFHGRGHGHGVGLCQYGAEALAQSGSGYLDILRWYYPGAYVMQAYDPRQRQQSLLG